MKQAIVGAAILMMTFGLARSEAIIDEGLSALKQGLIDRAVNIWLNGSLLSRAGKTNELTQQYMNINQLCGKLNDWHLLSSESLGPKVKINQYVLHFDRCPIFGKFTVYSQENLDVITQLKFNTKLNNIQD